MISCQSKADNLERLEITVGFFSVGEDEEYLHKTGQMHSLNSVRFPGRNKRKNTLFQNVVNIGLRSEIDVPIVLRPDRKIPASSLLPISILCETSSFFSALHVSLLSEKTGKAHTEIQQHELSSSPKEV